MCYRLAARGVGNAKKSLANNTAPLIFSLRRCEGNPKFGFYITQMSDNNTGNGGQRLEILLSGRKWLMERTADLETLWESIGENLDEDERLPYWAEIWPSSIALARWLLGNGERIRGRACLDVGCGLGLTALVASDLGARVLAVDYELEALEWARTNTVLNGVESPLWTQMDWRTPAIREQSFSFVWGGDIFYEARFFEPLRDFFKAVLAPDGVIWIADQERNVSRPVWNRLGKSGFEVEKIKTGKESFGGQNATVNIWSITRI